MSWFFGSGSGERSEEKQNESFSRERERLQALNIETEARIWKREDFEKFRKRCSSEGAAWKQEFVDEQRKLTVWTAPTENEHNMLKARKVFDDISADMLYDMIHDHEFRLSWDENMLKGKTIEELDFHNTVGYYAVKLPTGITNRDFVNQRSWIALRDEDPVTYIICNHSVLHPDAKPTAEFVRGWSHLSGYIITALPGGGCELVYCTHADPRGWLPAWLLNNIITVIGPKIVDRIEKVAPTYNDWVKKQRGENPSKPWLTPPNSPSRD